MRRPLHESRWFAFLRGAIVLLIVPLVGCTLGARNKAAVPPPPSPAAVQPPAPDQPLSIPQTAVTLPGYQEVNPDAIPQVTAQAPAPGKPEAPPAASRPKPHATAGSSKPVAEDEPEAPPAPAVQEQAPIQPILTGEEQKRIQDAIETRKRSARGSTAPRDIDPATIKPLWNVSILFWRSALKRKSAATTRRPIACPTAP